MSVKHIVFATGLGGGVPNIPDIPGRVKLLTIRGISTHIDLCCFFSILIRGMSYTHQNSVLLRISRARRLSLSELEFRDMILLRTLLIMETRLLCTLALQL